MTAMLARRGLLTGLLTLFCAGAGCGWIVGEAAEQKVRQDALEKVEYDDLDALWAEAVKLWDEYDCALPSTAKADETFECEDEKRWLRVKSASGNYRVELEHEFTRTTTNDKGETREEKVRQRDWDLEFKLLERVQPKKAEEINAAAEAKGQKAKDATRDLIDAFE